MVHPVNVRILCGNPIVREGLSRILTENQFQVSQFHTLSSMLDESVVARDREEASLLLVDIGIYERDDDGLSFLKEHFPSSHLVLLVDKFDFDEMLTALRDGASSYILKEISCERLVATLRLVAIGERVLPPQLFDVLQSRSNLGNSIGNERPVDAACLSEREFQILRWLIMGHPNKVISQRMDISEATVKVHVKSVLRKLNVQNRTQAAIWATRHGVSANNGVNADRKTGPSADDSPQLPMFKMSGR